jgi:uncharacterized membrane protein
MLRRRNLLAVGLLLSLGLNLFLGALMVGRWMRHEGPEARLFGKFERVLDRLPEADREPFRRLLDLYRPSLESEFEKLRAAKIRIGDLLAAQPLDEAALRAALNDAQRGSLAIQDRSQLLVLEAAHGLPPADRRDLLAPRY